MTFASSVDSGYSHHHHRNVEEPFKFCAMHSNPASKYGLAQLGDSSANFPMDKLRSGHPHTHSILDERAQGFGRTNCINRSQGRSNFCLLWRSSKPPRHGSPSANRKLMKHSHDRSMVHPSPASIPSSSCCRICVPIHSSIIACPAPRANSLPPFAPVPRRLTTKQRMRP